MLNHLLQDVLSKRKYFISEGFGKTSRIGGLFSKKLAQEHCQNIRWSTLHQDLTAF